MTDYKEFLQFTKDIRTQFNSTDIRRFGIVLDSCHITSTGYCPYQYLKYFLDHGEHVDLIHYNDSMTSFNSRIDRHAPISQGKIPWKSLEDMAQLASSHNIDMVIEY